MSTLKHLDLVLSPTVHFICSSQVLRIFRLKGVFSTKNTVATSQATITHRPIKPVEEAKIFVHTPEKPDVYPVPSIRPLANWDKSLSEDTIQKYKKIYEYQRLARWDDADNVFGQLGDMRLRGHALYDRYMDANYRSEFEELADSSPSSSPESMK